MYFHEVTPGYRSLQEIRDLVHETDGAPLREEEAYAALPALASRLPAELVAALLAFRESRCHDALILRGLPVGRIAEAPTPKDVHTPPRAVYGFAAAGLAVLGTLGTPFAYRSQQNRRLVDNISPMAGSVGASNVGIGSELPFELHSENAFMPNPPGFLQLSCVRNPQSVPTTVAGLHDHDLDDEVFGQLTRPHYLIGTNPAQRTWGQDRLRPGAVLWGGRERPLIRFNSVATVPMTEDPGAAAALDTLRAALEKNTEDACLAPGDILVVNNYRLCHARRSFAAKFDGADRWLLRTVAYRDPYRFSTLPTGRTTRPTGSARTSSAVPVTDQPR